MWFKLENYTNSRYVCILPPNFSESPLDSSDPFGGDKLEVEGVFSEIFGAGEAFDLRLGESIEDFSDELWSFKLGDFLKGASFLRPAAPLDLPPPRGGSGPYDKWVLFRGTLKPWYNKR